MESVSTVNSETGHGDNYKSSSHTRLKTMAKLQSTPTHGTQARIAVVAMKEGYGEV